MLPNISPTQLIILLVIVVVLFGTKKLRTLGSDLGSAVRGFRKGLAENDADGDKDEEPAKLEADPPTEAGTAQAKQTAEAKRD